MKTIKNIRQHIKDLQAKGLVFNTSEEVFGRQANSREFRQAYDEEMMRLNLIGQIKKLRTARRLTQKAVAKKAEMPQSVVARLESGEHSFSFATLARVARVFDKQVELV